jgi:D-beta-D-heptose 7-phosphate kinase/D-beta-D-heptose 1-phosphate adenosyltransferase
MGDALIVAINSDEATRRLTGEPRPLLTAEERAAILSALPFVDYVTVFDEDTPEELLRQLRPEILVKGAPTQGADQHAVGQEIVEGYGGQVRFVWFEGGTSTASMLARVSNHRKGREEVGEPG